MGVTVLVGTDKGAFVLRADDSRRRWDITGPLFKGWKVTSAARNAAGDHLIGTASMVYGAAIQRSRDLKDWHQVAKGPSYDEGGSRKLNQIWKLLAHDDVWYAGVDEAGLFRSRDGGETWEPLGGLNDHPTRAAWFPGAGGLCAHAVLVDPRNPRRIWCGISAVGVFRSDDGGETWHAKNRGVPVIIEDKQHPGIGFCVHALAQDSGNADRIFRQDHRGMFRTQDGGESWERIENGLPSGFGFPLARDRTSGALFVVPLESDEYRIPHEGRLRVYRSTDDGDSWQALTEGLPQEHAYAGVLRGSMDTDHLDPCGVYFGTTSGDVYVSANRGDTWKALPYRLPRVHCIAVL